MKMAAPSMGDGSVDKRTSLPIYVLVTPSRNEDTFIEKTLGERAPPDRSASQMGDRE